MARCGSGRTKQGEGEEGVAEFQGSEFQGRARNSGVGISGFLDFLRRMKDWLQSSKLSSTRAPCPYCP